MIPSHIHFRAEFTIEEGKIEDFKNLIQEIAGKVQETEPDTITYQFYLNKDNTKCIVHEAYANSDAAISHMNGIASKTLLPKIFEVAKIGQFDTYGIPSEELQKILLAGFGSEMYNLFTGFSRRR
jgi:quinol monooxygenase YgiN